MANEADLSEQTEIPTDEEEKANSPLKSRRGRTILIIVGAIAVILLLIWFIRYELHGKYIESTNDAYFRADSVTISPKVSGYVQNVYVADNQDVKAGQPLVKIDPRDYSAQTAQYQAQIDVAGANVENVQAQIAEQQAAIDQARAQLATAQSDAAFAASEEARYAPLAASGAETTEKLSSLRNQAKQAANTVTAQRAALESAERRVGSLKAQQRQAAAQGEAAKAQLAAANVNLGSTVLQSSVTGRVGDKTVRVGQFVQAGTRMMSVVPLSGIYIVANFKETQVGRMRIGQPATIHVDALSGVNLHGHIESLSPGTGAEFSLLPPQNATGNFTKIVQRVPVRIAIDAGPEARSVLIPGLSATVKVDTISAKDMESRIRDQEKARRRAGE